MFLLELCVGFKGYLGPITSTIDGSYYHRSTVFVVYGTYFNRYK